MQPDITATSSSITKEFDANMYREKAKEESSDESTIISSQTSTLTRNQECEGLQNAINIKLEELSLRCFGDESDDSEEEDDEDFANIEEDILEVSEESEDIESIDKETNTECAFFPDQSKQKLGSNDRYIKRSQTFSPSAVVPKNRYICRLNRSDSDSAMPLYRRGGPFQRNTFERRSLRWRRPSASMAMLAKHEPGYSQNSIVTARTSLDLELDLQAQHTRLFTLNDELDRLRELKQRLEVAKEQGDTELATWVLEDQQFQYLIAQAENTKTCKTAEEKKVEKMLRKTSKEIYKLRKSKAGKGKPDVISFK